MAAPRILVIDGNVAEVRSRQQAALGYDSGTGYARMLSRLRSDVVCDIIRPADGKPALPSGVGLDAYDGATITGSALNICEDGDPVRSQIEFAKAVFAAGVPVFGSCWGLQVAVTVAGGEVRANPRGREFGFARRIQLTEAGRTHPLFAGKPAVFEAPAVHRDEIARLPAGAVSLATNEMGLQAAAFSCGRATIWGVQYHPEYDYLDIAAAARRYGAALVEEGMFPDEAALESFTADLADLQADRADQALLWKYGLGPAVANETLRLVEIRNWLGHQVVPRCRRRG